jgi:type VI protein secretion system component VasA
MVSPSGKHHDYSQAPREQRGFPNAYQIHCEDQAFVHGALTLSAVLSHFFPKHASDNSFTQTILHTRKRGEVHRWPATIGQRQSV